MSTPRTVDIAQLIKYGASVHIKKSSSIAAELPFSTPVSVQGLYLHVPFCFHKCHYCDFYSIVDQQDRREAFVNCLTSELAHVAPRIAGPISTVFVGGGTPTLLSPDMWRRILDALCENYQFAENYELTVEANPETVTAELINTFVAGSGGVRVNRISIGAQSFNPTHLKTLERWHDPDNVGRAVHLIRDAGIENINLDLIFGIPGQSLDDWTSDLRTALSLDPYHLSCYGLMYEPNTPMTARLKRGEFERADEDLEADMYACTIDTLSAAPGGGFEHYEISNWARTISPLPLGEKLGARASGPPLPLGEGLGVRASGPPLPLGEGLGVRALPNGHLPTNSLPPSFRCRHNLLYWLNKNWWAFGPGASAHIDGWRWKNVPKLSEYLDHAPHTLIQDAEHIDDDARIGETLMLRLRLLDGIPVDELNCLLSTSNNGDHRRAAIDKYVAGDHLARDAGRLRFTRAGLMIADTILADLL